MSDPRPGAGQVPPSAVGAARQPDARSDPHRFILYVEDNDDNRRLVTKLLGSRGIRVLEAADGWSGLRSLEQERPPLVLLDISLPDLDGLQLLAMIRRHPDLDLRATPIIALTASAMAGDRERFLNQGCDDYLSKPLQALELIAMVERYLD